MNNPLQSVRNWFTVPRAGDVAALQAQVARLEAAVEAAEVRGEGGDSASIPQGELGFTGLKIVNGVIDDEYLTALDDLEDRIAEYDRMRGMGSVAALMQAIRLPILGAHFRVDPVDEKNAGEVELAERVQANLLGGMTHTFDDFLRHATLGCFYGFALFEKVFEEQEGGWVGWRKFAPRKPTTVEKWTVDATGGLSGIEQRGYAFTEDGGWTYRTGVPIPIEKLLLMSWQQEYGNFEGRGIFRDCYRHFYYADKLHNLAAIRCERAAIPVPTAEYDTSAVDNKAMALDDEHERELLTALQRLGRHESSALLLPWGVRLNKGPVEGEAAVPFLDYIQHHETQILMTGLAQFLGLGQGENTGAYALSKDGSSFFLKALNYTARWICNYLNRYAIRQLVDFNESGRTEYPELACEDIGVDDQKALSALLLDLKNGEFIDRPDEVGDYVREVFGLPEMPEDRRDALEEAREKREEAALILTGQTPVAAAQARQAGAQAARNDDEQKADAQAVAASLLGAVEFAEEGAGEAPAELAQAEDAMRDEGEALLDAMVTGFVKKCGPLAEKRDWAGVADVRVPLVGKYSNWLRGYLMQVVEAGRDAMAASAPPAPITAEVRSWARAQAQTLADYHAGILRFAVTQSLMNDTQAGMGVAGALRNAQAIGNGAVTAQVDEDLMAASEIVIEKVQEAAASGVETGV
jgi:hypothetical protein